MRVRNCLHNTMLSIGVVLALISGICQVQAQTESPTDDLLEVLTAEGVELTDGLAVTIPKPMIYDGQGPAERQQALEELAGKVGWQRFSRNSVVAPVMIDIKYIKNDRGAKVGHRIHHAFVAYADLDTLRDEEMMERIFGRPGDSDDAGGVATQEVPGSVLARMGLDSSEGSPDSFAYVTLPLLNKVTVRGVIRMQRREGPKWFELAWQLEPRFARSGEFANTWTKIERNAVGKPIESAPVPYSGCAGFVSVHQIDDASHQLLIETRMVLYEPEEWFGGSNFLRSKLPISMQENARSFRRKLSK